MGGSKRLNHHKFDIREKKETVTGTESVFVYLQYPEFK